MRVQYWQHSRDEPGGRTVEVEPTLDTDFSSASRPETQIFTSQIAILDVKMMFSGKMLSSEKGKA